MPTYTNVDDAELVRHAQDHDTDAYAELVVRYECGARIVALRYLPDHASAEDAVQEAFFNAYRGIRSLRDGRKFAPWLMRITQRAAKELARDRSKYLSLVTSATPKVENSLMRINEDLEEIVYLINQLPQTERILIVLRHLDQLTVRDIANRTGRPVGTVTKQLSRAMKRLQKFASKKERRNARLL